MTLSFVRIYGRISKKKKKKKKKITCWIKFVIRGAYLLWWHIKCLQPCIDSFKLIEAGKEEEHAGRLLLPTLDTTETEDHCTLILINHLNSMHNNNYNNSLILIGHLV